MDGGGQAALPHHQERDMIKRPFRKNTLSKAGLVVLLVSGAATAAVALIYMTTSTSTFEVGPPPVVFEAGGDRVASDYVHALALSPNRTSFDLGLRGVPEAKVVVGDLLRMKNQDTRPHTVTLSTATVQNPVVSEARLEFLDGETVAGVLDFKAVNPTVTFQDMPAGQTLTVRSTLWLAPGAGLHNVGDARQIALTVSS